MDKREPADLNDPRFTKAGMTVLAGGVLFDLMDPDIDIITIEDIAHGLSNNCRWNGHTKTFFSIAQHCCMCHDMAEDTEREDIKITCLMHDAEEAFWDDIIRPLKKLLQEKCPEIPEAMENLRRMIFEKFNIPPETAESYAIDDALLAWEYQNVVLKNVKFTMNSVLPWDPERAKYEFLKRFNKWQQQQSK